MRAQMRKTVESLCAKCEEDSANEHAEDDCASKDRRKGAVQAGGNDFNVNFVC